MKMILAALTISCLFGCGYDDELTENEFHEVMTCQWDGVSVRSERDISCDRLKRDFELAKLMYTQMMGYDWSKFEGSVGTIKKEIRIKVWDRQILYCDQWFLGACVHFVKGDSSGWHDRTVFGTINLNNGGELLLHELFHFESDDPNHTHWGANGMNKADSLYRRFHDSLLEK